MIFNIVELSNMNDFALPLWVLEIHKKVWLVGCGYLVA